MSLFLGEEDFTPEIMKIVKYLVSSDPKLVCNDRK